jgi:hypothetical protein
VSMYHGLLFFWFYPIFSWWYSAPLFGWFWASESDSIRMLNCFHALSPICFVLFLSVCLSFFVTFTLIDKICCTVSLDFGGHGICSFYLLVPNSLSISKIFSIFVLSNLF